MPWTETHRIPQLRNQPERRQCHDIANLSKFGTYSTTYSTTYNGCTSHAEVSGNVTNLYKLGTYSTTYNGCSSHAEGSGNIINLSKFGKYVITYNGVICNPPEG